MPLPCISDSDSSEEEVSEVAGPITSIHGCVIMPSAALKDPSNVAKVPGQPKHSVSALIDTPDPPPKRSLRLELSQKGPRKETGQNMDAPNPPVNLLKEPADPDGWLKNLDGIEDLPDSALPKVDCTLDVRTFFNSIPDVTTTEFAILSGKETTDPASEDVIELDGDDGWHLDGSADEQEDL
ncbi:hypothetical protein JB92DRAFT_3104679 [Gautieria morchelliformis]|nr:hypothetical protein JB92DRAFT_3104679 [Gautieria morchelliformis]